MNKRSFMGLAVLVILGATVWYRAATVPATRPSDSVAEILADPNVPAGFERALLPRQFHFPTDHGPHENFRHEWWYFTGNLRDEDGAAYGFQLTFFRFALSAGNTPSISAWRKNQIMMGHFAISNLARSEFHRFERSSRAVLTLAGASADPVHLWIKDWHAELSDAAAQAWRLRAQQENLGIDLNLEPEKPMVLQGDGGLSRKGDEPGNASYYYSGSRLRVSGTLQLPQGPRRVTGTAWLDREWGTSALGREQVGWDWFALQFDDGTEFTFYRLRHRNGDSDLHSRGLLIDAAGATITLGNGDLKWRVESYWRSPHTGIEYPAVWQLTIPSQRLALTITPRLPDQEWHQRFRYWEGAVSVAGTRGDSRIHGVGYVEMTGYGPR